MTEPGARSVAAPRISVIVPVYNVSEWLRECLDGIVAQTFSDYECILVDDGSTDESGAIADEYAARDPRFTVIHQQNRGLSGARNAGLEVARGEYLSFVDSDDLIRPTMLERLLQAAEATGCRIAMCDLDYLYDGTHVFAHLLDGVQGDLLDEHSFWPLCCDVVTIPAVAMWNKLWERDIFDHARFEEGRTSEDIIILSDVIPGNCPIALGREPLYYYRKRTGSITTSGPSIANRLYVIESYLGWDPYFAEHGWTDVRIANLRYVVSQLGGIYERIGIRTEEDLACYSKIRRRVRALFARLLPAVLARPAVAARVIPYVIDERLHGWLFSVRARARGV